MEFLEVVPDLILELVHGVHVSVRVCLRVLLVHIVDALKRYTFLIFQLVSIEIEEIEDGVGLAQHADRLVVVVIRRALGLVDLDAVVDDGAPLILDTRHDVIVPMDIEFAARGLHVDKTPRQSALRVGDADRQVGPHKQHSLRLEFVKGLTLLIHDHVLVRYETVQSTVIGDFGQVSVVLDGDPRIRLERFKSELVAGSSESRRVEGLDPIIQQSREEIQEG